MRFSQCIFVDSSMYFHDAFFFECSRDHRDLHSFPTRRSSDLESEVLETRDGGHRIVRVQRREHEVSCHRGLHTNEDRKSTRLNSSHITISYAVFCLKKKKNSRYPSRSIRIHMVQKKHPNYVLN